MSQPPPTGTPPPDTPPPAPSAPWTAPAPPYPSLSTTKTSGLAIVSLIAGILFCFFITPVVAVVTGHLALDQIADSDGTVKGRGMAIAGATLGWIFLSLALLGVLAWVISLLAA